MRKKDEKYLYFFFQAEDGIRDGRVTGVQTCALPIWVGGAGWDSSGSWRPQDSSGWLVYLKQSDMNDPGPSKTFVFLDEREDSINDGYFIVDMSGYPDKPAQQIDRKSVV